MRKTSFLQYSIAFIVSVCLSTQATGQNKKYFYGADFGLVNDSSSARYCKTVDQKSARKTKVITEMKEKGEWTTYKIHVYKKKGDQRYLVSSKQDPLFKRGIVRTFTKLADNSYQFEDHGNANKLLREGSASSMIPLHLQDTVYEYYPKTGRIKTFSLYDQNRMITNKYWLANGKAYFDDIHYYVDHIPEYSLGPGYFRNHILKGLAESNLDISQVADNVIIGWVVMENGEAAGFHTLAGVYKELNTLLISLIKEIPGSWVPASLNGEAVRYYMQIPFNFIDRTEQFDNLELNSGILIWD